MISITDQKRLNQMKEEKMKKRILKIQGNYCADIDDSDHNSLLPKQILKSKDRSLERNERYDTIWEEE